VHYIVNGGRDLEVPAVFIRLPEEAAVRAVKPRCRWCKSFITDCRHNQEFDEEEEARQRALAEKAAKEASILSGEGISQLTPLSVDGGQEVVRIVKNPLEKFYRKAERDKKRYHLHRFSQRILGA
jgi:hypothetical protein